MPLEQKNNISKSGGVQNKQKVQARFAELMKNKIKIKKQSRKNSFKPERTKKSFIIPWFDSVPSGAIPNIGRMLAFACPFVAVTGTTLKNGVVMTLVLFAELLPMLILDYVLKEKLRLPQKYSIPLCVMSAMLIASYLGWVIHNISPVMTDALGGYIYLTAAYTIPASADRNAKVNSIFGAAVTAVNTTLLFASAMIVCSGIREILTFNQIWGKPIDMPFELKVAATPGFGMLIFGIFMAVSAICSRYFSEYLIRRKADEEN